MSVPFNPHSGLIVISVDVEGPSGVLVMRVALDTGASRTLLSARLLTAIGYSPGQAATQLPVTTASGLLLVPQLPILRLTALGQDRFAFPVMAHNLPPTSMIDGLLGLDFIRGKELKINFRTGLIDLT